MSNRLKILLNQNPELRPLLARAQVLSALQHHFASVAPVSLASSSQVLELQQGTLTIATTNTTLAAKLRQLGPELATSLRERGYEVSGIRVKVQVAPALRRRPVARKLSKTAQYALIELSRHLNDSPLKAALKKILRQAPPDTTPPEHLKNCQSSADPGLNGNFMTPDRKRC